MSFLGWIRLKTRPKGVSASKCDVGIWVYFQNLSKWNLAVLKFSKSADCADCFYLKKSANCLVFHIQLNFWICKISWLFTFSKSADDMSWHIFAEHSSTIKTIFKLPYFFQVDHLLFCNHVKDQKCFCLHFPNEGVNDSTLPWRGGGVPVLLPVDTNCIGWTMGWNFLLMNIFW